MVEELEQDLAHQKNSYCDWFVRGLQHIAQRLRIDLSHVHGLPALRQRWDDERAKIELQQNQGYYQANIEKPIRLVKAPQKQPKQDKQLQLLHKQNDDLRGKNQGYYQANIEKPIRLVKAPQKQSKPDEQPQLQHKQDDDLQGNNQGYYQANVGDPIKLMTVRRKQQKKPVKEQPPQFKKKQDDDLQGNDQGEYSERLVGRAKKE